MSLRRSTVTLLMLTAVAASTAPGPASGLPTGNSASSPQPPPSTAGSAPMLVIWNDGDSDTDIRITNAATGAMRRVYSDEEHVTYTPALSPNGKQVAVNACSLKCRILIIELSGGESRFLLPASSRIDQNGPPIWSPNGDRVAFLGVTDGERAIWTARSDGTHLKRVLVGNRRLEPDLEWSQGEIYYRQHHFRAASINGEASRVVVAYERAGVHQQQMSPDGAWMVATLDEFNDRPDGIYRFRPDGTEFTLLAPNRWRQHGTMWTAPQWNREGTRIVADRVRHAYEADQSRDVVAFNASTGAGGGFTSVRGVGSTYLFDVG